MGIFSPVSPERTPTVVFCRPDYGKQSVHSIPHNTMSHDYKGSSLPAKFKGCLLAGLLTVLIDSTVQKSQVRLFSTTWPLKWLGRLDSNQRMTESKSVALPLGYAPTKSFFCNLFSRCRQDFLCRIKDFDCFFR